MDVVDWRSQLQPDSRQRIVNKIMDTLKKHLPFAGPEGIHELKKIAERFEEKIYTAATSQSDYLRKISHKMLTMETKSRNTIPNQDNQAVDWRTQLQSDLRYQIVNIMIITLKKHQKFSGPEVLHELKTIAEKFEEEIYAAATSELEYVFLIWLKMSTIEMESQNTMPNQVGNSNRPPDQASIDLSAQTGLASEGDWREEIYQKIKILKEQYLLELSEMYQKIMVKLQEDSLPNSPNTNLKLLRSMLEHAITFLQITKADIARGYKEKSDHYEKQIINFINVNRARKPKTKMEPIPQQIKLE